MFTCSDFVEQLHLKRKTVLYVNTNVLYLQLSVEKLPSLGSTGSVSFSLEDDGLSRTKTASRIPRRVRQAIATASVTQLVDFYRKHNFQSQLDELRI